MHITNSSRKALDALAAETAWTPAFSEVRRSRATERARGAWQRQLFLDKMLDDDSPNLDEWPRVIRDAILQQHGMDDQLDCLFKTPFPYQLKHCEHWCFFPADYMSDEAITARFKCEFGIRELVWYQNPKQNPLMKCSIHFHVFVKKLV
jgi:hypothetical protein